MSKVEITINGVAYPCRPTMGAMLRFKKETGREVTEIETTSLSDLCTYLWCCIKSACRADGVEFELSLMDFADSITPENMDEWVQSVSEQTNTAEEAEGEKKSK